MNWDVIWPVVGLIATGGGIAAVAGFVGAFIESKREHKRWLRDKRLEAYGAVLATAERFRIDPMRAGTAGLAKRLDVPGQDVGVSRLIGGWPLRAEWRRRVL